MSEPTSPSTPPVPAAPSSGSVPTPPDAGRVGRAAGGGAMGALLSGSRASTLLIAASVAWLALVVFAASRVPAPGTALLLLVGAMLFVALALWIAAAFYSWAFRRRLGLAAWLSLPAAALLVFVVPWAQWFWSARVASHGPALTAIAEKYAYLPENAPRPLDPPESAGPFTVRSVTRFRGATALALTRPGEPREVGIALAPTDTRPEPGQLSADLRNAELWPLTGRWHRYAWYRSAD